MNGKWLLIGLLAAAAAGLWIYRGANGGTPVETITASKGVVHEFVDERARTRLPRTYLVTMPFDGRADPKQIAEGSQVSAGQLLAQIVPEDLALKVDAATAAVGRLKASIIENNDVSVETTTLSQTKEYVTSMGQTVKAAEAQVEASRAKRDYADKELQRYRKLWESQAITEEVRNQSELAFVEANVDYRQDQLLLSALQSVYSATALSPTVVVQYIERKNLGTHVLEMDRAEAEVRLEQALRDQRRGVMNAPVDGVLLKKHIENEQIMPSGAVLFEVGKLEELEVEVEVLTQDAVRIRPGQKVDLYGPALGVEPVPGVVQRIYPAGFTKVSSLGVEQQRVLVVASFGEKELAARLQSRQLGVGYRVRAKIYTAEAPDVVVIPRSAVFRATAGAWQAFVVDQGKARLKTIELGLSNDEFVEVRQGLSAGEEVILAPDAAIVDGDQVRPVPRTTR